MTSFPRLRRAPKSPKVASDPLVDATAKSGHLLSSSTGTWATFRLGPARWFYTDAMHRQGLMESATTRWAELAGFRVHERITTELFSWEDWARKLEARTRDHALPDPTPQELADWGVEACPSRIDRLVAQQYAIAANGKFEAEPVTYLSVRVSDEQMTRAQLDSLLQWHLVTTEERILTARDRLATATASMKREAFWASPASALELDRLVQRSLALGVQPEAHAIVGDTDPKWEAPVGAGAADSTEVYQEHAYDPYVVVEAFRDGERVTSYVTVLTLQHIDRQKALEPGFIPPLAYLARLDVPLEVSAVFEVIPGRELKTDAETLRRRVNNIRRGHGDAGEDAPQNIVDGFDDAFRIESEVSKRDPDVNTRLAGPIRVAVWSTVDYSVREGEVFDETERRAAAVTELRSNVRDLIRTAHEDIDMTLVQSNRQYTRYREFVPGNLHEAGDYTRRMPAYFMATTVPNAANRLGEPGGHCDRHGEDGPGFWQGPILGGTGSHFFDHHYGPHHNMSGFATVTASPGAGKALALDTPLPTPGGWTTMGEIRRGDQLFDERGRPTNVVAVTEVMYDHRCFEVEFDDGSVIVADAGHQWATLSAVARSSARQAGREPWAGISTTEEIAHTLIAHGKSNHCIPTTEPVQARDARLTIDPYVLGVWLGDGTSRNSQITMADDEVLEHVRNAGYDVRKLTGQYHYGVGSTGGPGRGEDGRFLESEGLYSDLRRANLLNNKHIPEDYLRASERQRWDLLAGLMDTDGTCDEGGSAELTLTSQVLAAQALDLILGLGLKAAMTTKAVRGRSEATSTAYRIHFTTDRKVFRLTRKAERQPVAARGTVRRRYIVAVREVRSVPVRCVQVDSANHLYLAGRAYIPTHNSILGGHIMYDSAVEAGVPTVGLSLGDWERLVEMPELRKDSRLVNLASARPGSLPPHSLVPEPREQDFDTYDKYLDAVREADADRRDYMLDMLQLQLSPGVMESRGTAPALEAAVDTIGGSYGTNPWRVIDALRADGDFAAELADMLEKTSRNKGYALMWPEDRNADEALGLGTSNAMLTIYSMRDLVTPPAGVDPRYFNRQERASRPALYGASRLCMRTLTAIKGPKVVVTDEVGIAAAGQSALTGYLVRGSRDSRKNEGLVLSLGQNPMDQTRLDAEIANLIGTGWIGRIPDPEVAARGLGNLGIPQVYSKIVTSRLGEGRWLRRDWHGNVERYQHVVPPRVLAAIQSTPEQRRARVALQEVVVAEMRDFTRHRPRRGAFAGAA